MQRQIRIVEVRQVVLVRLLFLIVPQTILAYIPWSSLILASINKPRYNRTEHGSLIRIKESGARTRSSRLWVSQSILFTKNGKCFRNTVLESGVHCTRRRPCSEQGIRCRDILELHVLLTFGNNNLGHSGKLSKRKHKHSTGKCKREKLSEIISQPLCYLLIRTFSGMRGKKPRQR